MAIAFVKSTTGNSTSSPTVTTAFTGSTSSGNLIVVTVGDDSGTTTNGMAITDSKGNSYTKVQHQGGNATVSTWYAENIVGGASHTVTATWSMAATGTCALVAQEFSGVATSSSLDKTAIASGTSTSPSSGATAATTQADELVVGGAVHDSTASAFSLGSGYSNLGTVNIANAAVAQESKIVAATGAQTATLSIAASRFWICGCLTFKAAGGAGTQTLAPVTIASGATVGTPTVTPGAVSRSPVLIASAAQVFALDTVFVGEPIVLPSIMTGVASFALDGFTFYHRVGGWKCPSDEDGVEWTITNLEGWIGSPPPRPKRADRVAGHGVYRSALYKGARVITLDIVVTTPYREDVMRRLEPRIAAICSDPHTLYDLVEVDPYVGQRSAQVELDGDIKIAPRDGLTYSSVVSLQLAAPDPRLYGPWLNAQTLLADGGTGGLDMGSGANLSDPGADMGTSGTDGVATLITAGTAGTGVVLEIEGPVDGPVITCPELGVQVAWSGSLQDGEIYKINLGEFPALGVPARSSLPNRDDLLTVTGGWPSVPPGVSHWQFAAATYSSTALLTVHARSAYW